EDGIRDFHVTGVQTCALPILILIDPKEIEMPQYKGFPQAKVITDMSQSIETVESLCLEMDKRYSKIATSGYRNIKQYNNNSTTRSEERRVGKECRYLWREKYV